MADGAHGIDRSAATGLITATPLPTSRADDVGPWRIHALASQEPTGSRGPALVLVHGLGMSSRYLAPTVELLAGGHHVLAPDLPGAGRSSRPDRVLQLSELADALVAWMDVVGLERPVLVGHSIGCQVITHVAERHPARVERLVLASPTGDPSTRRWRQAARLLGGSAREAPALVPVAVRDYLRAGPLRMWRTLGRALDDDVVERLRRVPHGALVVRGSEDTVVSGRWADAVAAASGAPLVTIPGAPHGLPFSAAPALADVVERFLAP